MAQTQFLRVIKKETSKKKIKKISYRRPDYSEIRKNEPKKYT